MWMIGEKGEEGVGGGLVYQNLMLFGVREELGGGEERKRRKSTGREKRRKRMGRGAGLD